MDALVLYRFTLKFKSVACFSGELYVYWNGYAVFLTHAMILTFTGDYLGSRQQHSSSRDWSDAVTEEEEQEQLHRRETSGYRGGRPRYRGGGRGGRREGFNTGTGYRPPQSRK